MEGWGSQVRHSAIQRPLDKHQLHINVLELRAVRLTLLHLEQEALA